MENFSISNGNRYMFFLEGEKANFAFINDHFLPTSDPGSAMGYLEPKLLRFQGLICRIVVFSSFIITDFIAKNVKNINFTFLQICKKKTGKYFCSRFWL